MCAWQRRLGDDYGDPSALVVMSGTHSVPEHTVCRSRGLTFTLVLSPIASNLGKMLTSARLFITYSTVTNRGSSFQPGGT